MLKGMRECVSVFCVSACVYACVQSCMHAPRYFLSKTYEQITRNKITSEISIRFIVSTFCMCSNDRNISHTIHCIGDTVCNIIITNLREFIIILDRQELFMVNMLLSSSH